MARPHRRHIAEALRSRAAQLRFGLGSAIPRTVEIVEDGRTHTFVCHNLIEYVRAQSLTYKEPGTYRWISTEVREGDVFYDVGANIGVYTLPAASRVGPGGRVIAFEPHVANTASLLRNVAASGYADRVTVISTALDSSDGFLPFRYGELASGTAMSQLDASLDGDGESWSHVAAELKHATTVDALISTGTIPDATHVKIDVDGNELRVLEGMRGLLESGGLRTLQVEVNPDEREPLLTFMEDLGYELSERHYSQSAEATLAEGARAAASVPFNAIFRPKS